MTEIKKEKLMRGGMFVLVSLLVYLGLKFVLPVVLPFGIGWVLAVKMRRTTRWLKRRLRIPEMCSAMVLLAVEAGVAGLLLYTLGGKLLEQISVLSAGFPDLLEQMEDMVFSCCQQAEQALSLPDGVLVGVSEQARGFVHVQMEQKLMPAMAGMSAPLLKGTLHVLAVFAVSVIACMLSVTEMDVLKQRQQASTFGTEVTAMCRRLSQAGGAYLKSQLLIWIVVTAVCIAGLWILGNPYPVVAGIGLGIVDVLPVLGTGTVLLPWALFALLGKDYMLAAGLMIIYGISYFFRELAEARLMGNQMGITGLETLVAIYVGVHLFGIWGMLLGPAGYLLIRELLTMY